jgi:hypothetical protein
MGEIEPRREFSGIITVTPLTRPRHGWHFLLDFAFRYYGTDLPEVMEPKDLYRYSIAFLKSLWTKEPDGFCCTNRGLQWYKSTCFFAKRDEIKYELGWVGQSGSIANAMLKYYLETGDKDALYKATSVLDSWIEFSKIEGGGGLHRIKFDGPPTEQTRVIPLDACNLGQGAFQFFEAANNMEKIGDPRPKYREFAMDVCNFALNSQKPDGEFAKSWNEDGSVKQQSGTIGAFLIPPLLVAYDLTGDKKFLDSSVKAFAKYYSELSEHGFTTAGALDTYCIDKESASPLLAAALELYKRTNDKSYVDAAETVAWYLSTWMMHYSIKFPADSTLAQVGYNSFGATAVSTAHNAIDQYALKDVLGFLELAKLTGNEQWHKRGVTLWKAASQLVSDGTLCIMGRVRPAGSQDEAAFHTRWSRKSLKPYNPSQWLVAWPVAFRMEVLRNCGEWDQLN